MTLLEAILFTALVIGMPGAIWMAYVIGHNRGCMSTYDRLKDFWKKP